jgi:hypothetical protein
VKSIPARYLISILVMLIVACLALSLLTVAAVGVFLLA